MPQTSPARPTVVVSSTRGRLGAAVVAGLATLALLWEGLQGGPMAALRALPWLALLVLGSWLMWGCARLVLGDDDLVIDGPLLRTELPWPSITSADSRWGLQVEAGGRSHKSWAAPARGGVSIGWGARPRPVDPNLQVPAHTTRSTTVIRLDLGAHEAAQLVCEQALARSPGAATGAPPHHQWHVARLVLLVVLAAACLGTVLL